MQAVRVSLSVRCDLGLERSGWGGNVNCRDRDWEGSLAFLVNMNKIGSRRWHAYAIRFGVFLSDTVLAGAVLMAFASEVVCSTV